MKHKGPISRIVTEAFAYHGIKVKHLMYGESWKRAFNDAEKGVKAVGSFAWSKKAKRQKLFLYSDPIFAEKTILFFVKEKHPNFDWKTFEDLREYKIGTVLGYFYGSEFEQAVKNKIFKTQEAPKEKLNFLKLSVNRVDLVPASEAVGWKIIKENFPERMNEFDAHPKSLKEESSYHLIITKRIGKEGEDLISKFNSGLKKLKESGKVARYIKEELSE